MSRRNYKKEQSYIDWLKSLGCVFYAPLDLENGFKDLISGKVGVVQYNNTAVWDNNENAFLLTKDSSYSPVQGIIKWSGLNMNIDNTNIEYSALYEINVKNGGYNPWGSPTVSEKWIMPYCIGERQALLNMENYGITIGNDYKCSATISKYQNGKHHLTLCRDGNTVFAYDYTSKFNYDTTVKNIIYINCCNAANYTGCKFYEKNLMIFNKALDLAAIRKIQGYDN